ncbi:MAG TPA: phosphotransferase [Marinagarivorans sp.]
MTIHESLAVWVNEQLAQRGIATAALSPIVGDAGFRQYFRLASEPALLAVYGPPEIEKHPAFVAISQHWRENGVPAPRIVAWDFERGFLLIEDFGPVSLSRVLGLLSDGDASTRLPSAPVAQVYQRVLAQLKRLQQLEPTADYPYYDARALQAELDLFIPWFVEKLLGYVLSGRENDLLTALFKQLIEQALAQPQVIVHRDFHCRNIHVCDAPASHEVFGFIDFQDAVVGPVTYDVVSLLKDCYQQWPQTFVEEQALGYRKTLPEPLQMSSEQRFLRAMDATGLQRHLKVLGIFARLYLRDGKAQYLNDLPLVIAYVRHVLARYDAFRPVAIWFDKALMPVIAEQPWFHSVVIQP